MTTTTVLDHHLSGDASTYDVQDLAAGRAWPDGAPDALRRQDLADHVDGTTVMWNGTTGKLSSAGASGGYIRVLGADWDTAASAALADVPDLSFTLTAAGNYAIDADLSIQMGSSDSFGDMLGFALGGAATTTGCLLTHTLRPATAGTLDADAVHTYRSVLVNVFGDGGVIAKLADFYETPFIKWRIKGIVNVSVAGTLRLRGYMQTTAEAPNLLLANSTLRMDSVT